LQRLTLRLLMLRLLMLQPLTLQLPTLRPGETTDILVRYVVAGALAPGDPMPLPRLGVTVLGNYTALVPEPASAALVSAGLIALAARARARRSRG